ncbi:MAG: glycosyltransferase [Pseudomonadota bacterium]
MPALAVVVKGYPRLSETFIAQELCALQSRGMRFDIWSLRAPYDDREHPMHAEITARRRYLPDYLHDAPGRVLRGWRRARSYAGYAAARADWLADLRRDATRNRVRRWGQALVLAAELPPETRFLYAHFLHTPASVARYAARIRGLGWGVSAHAKDIWTIPDWDKRAKLRDAAFAVACTGSGAAHLAALAPAPQKVTRLYHGLDLRRFPDPPSRQPSTIQPPTRQPSSGQPPPRQPSTEPPSPGRATPQDAPTPPLKLVSVGRLVAKKGYDILLEALAALPERLDWQFTHIGGGALKADLAARAAALGLSDRIVWQGKRDQLAVIAALRAADLFVLPSRILADGDRDGLPNVLMEAASQALPILSTRVSAIPEFITDGVHGRLVRPEDPAALAAAIEAHARDPDAGFVMAQAAYARLRNEFGMEAGIDLLEARLLAGLGAVRPQPEPVAL